MLGEGGNFRRVIPDSFDDVTPDWLTDALRDGGHLPSGRVTAVRQARIGEGSGFMGKISELQVDYDGAPPGTPTRFVAKMAADPGPNRDMGVNYRIYEKESRFYSELAPQVALRTPKPYVNRFDPSTHSFVLVLEHLAPMEVGSELVTPTDEQVRLSVTEMARFHAAWWDPDGTTIPEWIPRLCDPPWPSHEQFWAFAWPMFLEQRGHSISPEMRAAGDLMVDHVLDLQQVMCRPPLTIIHMDWRAANLFFAGPDGGDPFAVVDWQPFSRSRGPYDLGYFLSQSIPVEQRRRMESDMLALYLDTLVANGVTDYSADDLLGDYRRAIAYTLLYPMGTVTIDLATEAGRAYADAITERASAAATDHDVAAVIPQG